MTEPTRPVSGRPRTHQQRIGSAHEDAALRWLMSRGLRLLARNQRTPYGEIDLILRHGADMVFVEVRARCSLRFGGAAASVSAAKQQRMIASTAWLLPTLVRQHWAGVTPTCRYDVVAFEAGRLHWLRAAFDSSVAWTMR